MSRIKENLNHKKIRRLIWLVLTLFVLLVYSLQSGAGSAYYSMAMHADGTVSSPPVFLEKGNCSGASTIYTNKTSAKVNVTTPVFDYVDNNYPDVDSSADKGTHSNFTAQQYGPDSTYDTLTEQDTAGPISVALIVGDPSGDESSATQDIPFYDHINARVGWTVTYLAASPLPDVSAYDLVEISYSVGTSVNFSSWKTLAKPILIHDRRHTDDIALTTTEGGYRSSQTTINITDNTQYITSSYSLGDLAIASSTTFSYAGTIAGDVDALATISGHTTDWVLLEIDIGETLSDAVTSAPERRVYYPPTNYDATTLNSDGWAIFDRVIDWLVSKPNTNGIAFEGVTVSSEQSTTNTAWTDVPGASVSFTPSSSTEEWLIFVTADIRSTSTLENRARFRYDINGTSQRGETGVQQGTTSASPIDPYNVYFHFSRITGVTSQQTVKFQFQASSGATAYARNIHILCIRLNLAGLEYTEVNGNTSITGSQTLATLQFTPPSSGDYIIAYCALVSKLPTGTGAETWLDYDSGTSLYPDAWSTPNTRRIHTDGGQFEPHGLFTKVNLTASQHTFKVQAQLRTAGNTSTARDVRIAAFRVDAFDLLEFDEDTAISSTTEANTVRSTVNTTDPGEERNYLILAGIHTISNGTSSREAGGIEIDDAFVQRKGDQRLDDTEIARTASHYACVKTSSTSFTVETTSGTGGTGADTVYSKQSVIYILKIPKNYELDLEVQWTNADFDETNEELCIYGGTMGTENITVYVWNGSAWQNVFTNLTSGWNNVSVSSYLNSSTFTIQFKGGNETGDTTQDNWNIDTTLLHMWTGESNYDYVLKVTNQVADDWTINLQVYDSTNIARLSKTTISFHDSTSSDQIIVTDGNITQSEGASYNLPGGVGSTIYISMSNLQASTSGTSHLYVYLKILVPDTSTYAKYIITFEIT